MTIIFRPDTLEEALRILARPALVQVTAGGPPPAIQPGSLVLDTGGLRAMSGIHQAPGRLIVGLNATYAALTRTKLLCPEACALVDACILREEETPGGVLLHDLMAPQAGNLVYLALLALGAEVELAWLDAREGVVRRWLPLTELASSQITQSHLLLNVRFETERNRAASALYREDNLGALLPDAWAAAIGLRIDPHQERISAVRIAFAPHDTLPIPCPITDESLGDLPLNGEAIAPITQWVQKHCLQPRAGTPLFTMALSSHLVRETMDRAIARYRAAQARGHINGA